MDNNDAIDVQVIAAVAVKCFLLGHEASGDFCWRSKVNRFAPTLSPTTSFRMPRQVGDVRGSDRP
jgi:hypothetical protein